jgi:hypothetical protein
MTPDPASDISHVIQLAVAPVFLLAGIGAFINAFAGRLGRIFDRGLSIGLPPTVGKQGYGSIGPDQPR